MATWPKGIVDVYDADRDIQRVGIGPAQFFTGGLAGPIRTFAVLVHVVLPVLHD